MTSCCLHTLIVESDLRRRMLMSGGGGGGGTGRGGDEVVLAGWLQSGDWRTARALGACHDVVVIDAEHGAISLDQIALCVEILAGNGCLAIVRVPFDDDARKAFARRCLDAGAIGILFPNVTSKAQAEACIRNCYYPSAAAGGSDNRGVSGTRGFGYGGCNLDGLKFAEYAKVANDRIVVGVQLEHRTAFELENLSDILSTPGLCFTQDGPYDHSGSYLCPGSTSDPRVLADLEKYRTACRAAGVVAGKHVVQPTVEAISEAVAVGYRFIAMGTDMLSLYHGQQAALDIARQSLEREAGDD